MALYCEINRFFLSSGSNTNLYGNALLKKFPTYDMTAKNTFNIKKQPATMTNAKAKKTKQKHNPWINFVLANGEWCDMFLPKDQRQQSIVWLHNCLQNAVLNACIQLNIHLKKETLYDELPPNLIKNLDM
eukprot:2423417-Ditylum_brightwellii.AAC.1